MTIGYEEKKQTEISERQKMKVEIDQSGKLEQLDTLTVIGFANGKTDAVVLSVSTKRSLIAHLRKSLIPQKDILPVLFGVVIFMLIESLAKNIVVVIDEEYTGKDQVVRETLEKLLRNKFGTKWTGSIRFQRVGKQSPAHKLVWGLHRQKYKKGLRKLPAKEILKYFSSKKAGPLPSSPSALTQGVRRSST